jgi:uncharacterized DUF497 family protein
VADIGGGKELDKYCKKVLQLTMDYVGIGVEWSEEKNEENKLKHKGLGFELAQFVFSDPQRLERIDRSEGNLFGEERMQTLGKVGEILFVVYTTRKANRRIISARFAEKHEKRSYNGYYYIDGKGWSKAD